MWAPAAPLPYYSAYKNQKRRPSRRDAKKEGRKEDGPAALAFPVAASGPPFLAAPAQHASGNIVDLLEPAVDGPPSPERIRALNQQMRRASILDKHQSHSSGSGSLRSMNSERPSWENTLEYITLSRRSSGRSTASSMPSRERPESLQLFGRTIFNRRGKIKRESSSHSSSGSSLYSTDIPLDGPATAPGTATRETFVPGIFSRRKNSKAEPIGEASSASALRRPQISGPYNFQHVTHARRDHLPNLQRVSRMELVSELSAIRAAQPPTNGSLRGIHADDLHFSDFPYEAADPLPEDQPERYGSLMMDRPVGPPPRQAPLPPGPRRLIKHSRSQEQLRITPPRPPRPPIEPALFPPVPPPRVSSRLSIRYDGVDPLATTTLERPQTSGGFRHPQPFSPGPETFLSRPPATSHGFVPRSPAAEEVDAYDFSHHALTTPDDAAWPLSSASNFTFETVLADVPEEEEHYILTRRSRTSLRSTNSSLRGSQSVPLLRQLAQSQPSGQQRPGSGASDTLGRFDMFAAKRSLLAQMEETSPAELVQRDSWEDAIDYCYEHEADADFDYAWERPSMDLTRDESRTPEALDGTRLGADHLRVDPRLTPNLLATPSHYDVPALSPASQTSTATQIEAVTPTAPSAPIMTVSSNFSLPRQDGLHRLQQRPLSLRRASHASSFKESHGFNLSPSLLIPNDFRHQMTLEESDVVDFRHPFDHLQIPQQAGPTMLHHTHVPYEDEDPTLTVERARAIGETGGNVRSSTSTTGSNSSDNTDSSERHVSTTSTWTAVTHMTGSIGSLSQADGGRLGKNEESDFVAPLPVSPQSPQSPLSPFSDTPRDRPVDDDVPLSPLSRTKSGEALAKPRSPKLLKQRRQRARTTSLSTPPPPPGQYALFPPLYAGNRI